MSRNFFRKVGYGLGPKEPLPSSPLDWAVSQVERVPEIRWDDSVPTTEDGLDEHMHHSMRRKEIRIKYADDPDTERRKSKENYKIVDKAQRLNLQIRLAQAVHGEAPVLERFVSFWANHFAIVEKDENASFIVGPYQREVIRQNMTGSFQELLTEATTSWAMITSLDNGESVPPGSKEGRWLIEEGKTPTINENHARELLELHTVSTAANFTQEDVIQLAYIMSGWRTKYTKKRKEFNPVHFDENYHQPGKFKVLGKVYKQRGLSSGAKLLDVLKDLANNPHTKEFLSYKLCRHFVCDNPTADMMAPIVTTWNETKGDLPSIHKALLKVVYEHGSAHLKITKPEIWFAQILRVGGATDIKKLRLRELYEDFGHNPFVPLQPNGWPDNEVEWLSPELLIRRIVYAKQIASLRSFGLDRKFDVVEMLDKNFDNSNQVRNWVANVDSRRTKLSLIFGSKWMIYS